MQSIAANYFETEVDTKSECASVWILLAEKVVRPQRRNDLRVGVQGRRAS